MFRQIRPILLSAAAFAPLLLASTAEAAKYDVTVDANVSYRIWIPDNVATIKGVLIHMNGSGDDDRMSVDDSSFYESFVTPMDFAYIGSFYQGQGSVDAPLTALTQFATMSNHPELANAPLLVEGISLGGYNAIAFAMAHPERTIAYVNAATRSFPAFKAAAKKTPSLHMIGSLETTRVAAFVTGVTNLRGQGHQAGYFGQWDVEHKWGQGVWPARNFLAACYVLRYPAGASPKAGPVTLVDLDDNAGWLLDPATYDTSFATIAPASGATSPLTKFWTPTEDIATIVRGHATHEKPASFVGQSMSVWSPLEVKVGDSVPLKVAVDAGFPNVAKVKIYDGATLVKELTQAPYDTTWTATRPGTHGIVAVAVDTAGAQRTGFSLPIVVAGMAPSGGTGPVTDGGGGGMTGDGGSSEAGSDDDSGMTGTADGGPGATPIADADGGIANGAAPAAGDNGGCGCREGVGSAAGSGGAVASLLALAAFARRRRQS